MIRVIIADDHSLVRVALTRLFKEIKSIDIVAEASTGEQAVDLTRKHRPHVVLMDLLMPGIGGLEAARRIVQMEADIRVVAVTAADREPYPSQALKAGVTGYVTKGSSADELVTAVKRAYAGQRYVSSDVAQRLAFKAFEAYDVCPFDQLSNREMQITLMVINCHRVQHISISSHLSPKTVNSYRYRIFEKLHVSSDVELVLLAVKHGMINPLTHAIAESA